MLCKKKNKQLKRCTPVDFNEKKEVEKTKKSIL
jgi:hypothetical protein